MAITIESSRQRSVRQSPTSGQKQSIDAPAGAFGGETGRAIVQTANALGKFGQDIGNRELSRLDKANRARALDLENQIQTELNSFLYDPEGGLLKSKGRNAISSDSLMQAKLQEVKKKYIGMKGEAPNVNQTLQASFTNIEKSYLNVAQRHAFGETENYEREALDSRIQFNRQEAALDFLNEDKFKSTLSENIQALEVKADMEGWSGDRLKIEKQKETSTLRSAQIASMVATDKPHNILLAKQEFEAGKQRGDFTFEESLKIENSLNAAVPKAAAQIEYQRIGGFGGKALDLPKFLATNKSAQAITDRANEKGLSAALAIGVFGAETDFGRNNKTSSAGAIGEMQTMPATLNDPGFGVQPAKDRSQEELRRVGVDYLAAMVNRYKGDEEAALIAYNAGPGNADKWVKAGRDYSVLPDRKQTEPYVQKALGYATSFDGENKSKQIRMSEEKLNKFHPDAGNELVKMLESDIKRQNAIEKQQKDELEDSIQEKVAGAGGDYTILSSSERAQAAEMGIDYTKYSGSSNPDTVNNLDAMTSDELFSTDLTELRGELSFDDLNKYRGKQAELQKPENKIVQDKIDEATRYYFRSELSQDPDNKTVKPKVAAMKRFISDQLQVRYENMGEVTDKDINEISATFFKNRVYDPSGLFNRNDNVYLMDVTEIPDGMRTSIEQSLNQDGQLVTENAIKQRYIMHLSDTGELQRNQ